MALFIYTLRLTIRCIGGDNLSKRTGLMAAKNRLGLTITKLAALVGITRTYCSLICNGHWEPSYEVWCKLSVVLGVSVEKLKQDIREEW